MKSDYTRASYYRICSFKYNTNRNELQTTISDFDGLDCKCKHYSMGCPIISVLLILYRHHDGTLAERTHPLETHS